MRDGYILVSKEESIIGNMYKSDNLHISSLVKCCTDLNKDFCEVVTYNLPNIQTVKSH